MSGILRYSLKRLCLLLVTMLLVSFLTFLAFEMVSGDPARTMLGTEATEAQISALQQELGLDKPFLVRYVRWFCGFFSGDLGLSYSYRQPVWNLIAPKLELTLWLSLMSFALTVIISIPLGIFSYHLTGGIWDWPRTAFNQLCMAIPPFFLYPITVTPKRKAPGTCPSAAVHGTLNKIAQQGRDPHARARPPL